MLRKFVLRGYDKRSAFVLEFGISESYEVSNWLQKNALVEFLAPTVAEKINAILFGLSKECLC